MGYHTNDIQVNGLDTKALSNLIIDLNIARRNCRAYPEGHPVITASLHKALLVYEGLMTLQDEIVLGVASDALMVAGAFLDKTNLVYRDFARVLFDHGIGALLLRGGLTLDELDRFTVILGLKREDILCQGGIEQVWNQAGIAAIGIRAIHYDLFSTTDEDSIDSDLKETTGEGLWERFARGLTQGGLCSDGSADGELDPDVLAAVLNRQFAGGGLRENSYSQTITNFMLQDEAGTSSGHHATLPYEKLAAFISNLNPELRRQFLNSSFALKNSASLNATERVISNLSASAVLETLEDINQNRLSVPSVIMGLLQRLGRHGEHHRQSVEQDISGDEDLSRKMKTIFREHASEAFIPDDYQQKLSYFIATDKIPFMQMADTAGLLETLESRQIEISIGEILTNLVKEGCETAEERELLIRNLSDLFGYFLQTGDYVQLHKMVDQITESTIPTAVQSRLCEEYCRREFLDEILNGLVIWGKPRYEDIRLLIRKLGVPFVEVLLDRLSEESSMSIRRFFTNCLIEMGSAARVPVVKRLGDPRWYFVRNLLIILCAQNDPGVVLFIRPMLHNSDQRVRYEALKSLVHFRDPLAEMQIVQNLNGQNRERLFEAIKLSERCSSPAVITGLTGLLAKGGLQQNEYEIKKAVVEALAETGRVEALPELEKILTARSLLHPIILTRLKMDILQSLERYPLNSTKPVLERLAAASGDVARQAVLSLQKITGAHR
ncbi:MAG: HEAT repeat domain-containing protein [Desulfuromonadaceae bacterium]